LATNRTELDVSLRKRNIENMASEPSFPKQRNSRTAVLVCAAELTLDRPMREPDNVSRTIGVSVVFNGMTWPYVFEKYI
jgi:hypothetical protein